MNGFVIIEVNLIILNFGFIFFVKKNICYTFIYTDANFPVIVSLISPYLFVLLPVSCCREQ